MNSQDLESAKAAIAQVRRLTDALEGARAKLNARRKQLEERMEFLKNSFVPFSDHKQFLKDYIDAQARTYLPSFREMMKASMQLNQVNSGRVFGNPDQGKPMRYHEMQRELYGSGFLSWPLSLVRVDKNNPMDTPFLFFFGEFVKRAIDLHFDELGLEQDYDVKPKEVGPPIADRKVEMEEITAEISAIDAEISSINSQLSSLR